jgi:hypothetical protein
MNTSQLIAFLNSIQVGDLDAIQGKLRQAREACEELAQPELSSTLQEAADALSALDVRTYKKRVATVISRLGHVR